MKNRLTFGAAVYGDDILMGGVDYSIDINGGAELTVGVAACGTLRFSVIAPNPFKIGDTFTWSRRQIEDADFAAMGQFTVASIQKQKQKYTIEAVDGMAKFDVPVDEWLNGLTYPTTHEALLRGLCGHVGVTLSSTSAMTCGDRAVRSSPAWEGATGRDILGFIAEASGCFARMLPDGSLYVGWYRQTDIALTRANYTGPFVADYAVAAIDKVQVRSSQNDIGVVVGNGENAYIIENNPLFYAESDADLRPYVERLLTKLSALTYTPCEVPMYNDRGLRPGDIFTIDGAQSVVMTLRCTASGSTVTSSGSETRPTQSTAKNRDVMALMGKTNELIRTVEETTSRLSDAEGQVSTLTQTVNGFDARITNAEGQVTTLTATVKGLDARISDAEGNISALSLTSSSFNTRITNAENDISTLEQTASSITLAVNQNSLAISNLGIQLTGYVTFSDLSTAGQTVINGGNIAAGGTISGVTLQGCTIQSVNGMTKIVLNNNMMNFQIGSYTYGQFVVTDDGLFKITGANGYRVTLYCGNLNPLVQIGSGYYDIIHAGNINNYIGNVYAVFG